MLPAGGIDSLILSQESFNRVVVSADLQLRLQPKEEPALKTLSSRHTEEVKVENSRTETD